MDTNLVTALAEALKQMPVQKSGFSGISDATWQILFSGIIGIALAWIGRQSSKHAKISSENSEIVKRIEKDVNSKSAVSESEHKATVEKVLKLSEENAQLREQVRGVPAVQSIPIPIPSHLPSHTPLPGVPLPNPLPITIVNTEEGEKPKYTDLEPK